MLLNAAITILFAAGLSYQHPSHQHPNRVEERASTPTHWKPVKGATWNIDLKDDPSTLAYSSSSKVHIYDLDLFAITKTTVKTLHDAGHRVICYYSAGSYENWRPDASNFPSAALGNPLSGWAGERWVDTTNAGVRAVMTERIKLAKSKGCDGVDPDNIDAYNNDPGFPLTNITAINYVKFLSKTAHGLGLASGLKNGGDIVNSVVNVTDWEVNEQCAQYDECDLLDPYLKANKPVFHIEYTDAVVSTQMTPTKAFLKKACGAQTNGMSTLVKHMALGTYTAMCSDGHTVSF